MRDMLRWLLARHIAKEPQRVENKICDTKSFQIEISWGSHSLQWSAKSCTEKVQYPNQWINSQYTTGFRPPRPNGWRCQFPGLELWCVGSAMENHERNHPSTSEFFSGFIFWICSPHLQTRWRKQMKTKRLEEKLANRPERIATITPRNNFDVLCVRIFLFSVHFSNPTVHINQLFEKNLVLPPIIRFKCSLLNLIARCTANAALVYGLHYPEIGQWHLRTTKFDGATQLPDLRCDDGAKDEQTKLVAILGMSQVHPGPRCKDTRNMRTSGRVQETVMSFWATQSEIIQLEADGSTQMQWLQEDFLVPIAPNPGTLLLESFIGSFLVPNPHRLLLESFMGSFWHQILTDFCWNRVWPGILPDFRWNHYWGQFLAPKPHRLLLESWIS